LTTKEDETIDNENTSNIEYNMDNTNNEESNNKDIGDTANVQQPNSNNTGDDSTKENNDKDNSNVQHDDTTQEPNDNTNASNENDEEKGNNDGPPATTASPGHDIKVMQTFTIEFNIRNTPATTIGSIHKEFITEILTVAPFTTFKASNKRTVPAPLRIEAPEHFPSNHLLHQKFFHRIDIREKVKYTHHVYSPVSVVDIKRRVMPFLYEHNIGMWNDEISNNSKVRICWILNAHSRVTYRPKMKEKLCIGLNKQQPNYGDENNRLLTQLPRKMHDIDLYTKTVTYHGHETEAVCVMAYKPAAPVIQELIGMLDHAYLGSGTSIVSEAAVQELDGKKYSDLINENTAFHQNTRTISTKYFHDLYWNHK
jgi:hypothetical protein